MGGGASLALLEEVNYLKQENKKLKEKLESIGTMYGGDFSAVLLEVGKDTDIAQVELHPGTYILIGGAQVNKSLNITFKLALLNSVVRFSGGGGGGASVHTIVKPTTKSVYKMSMYSGAEDVSAIGIYLNAIKVKE